MGNSPKYVGRSYGKIKELSAYPDTVVGNSQISFHVSRIRRSTWTITAGISNCISQEKDESPPPPGNLQQHFKVNILENKRFPGYRVHELFQTVNTPCSPDEFGFIKEREEYI